jgi:hypothetical protein
VTCELPGLATLAQEELDRCIAHRTASDISRIVQRLFERKADLFPIREKGAAYFVPQAHIAFVDRIQALLGKLNGRLNRFPVPSGTPQGDRSVKDAVANGIEELIAEHRVAIASFGDDTRASTIQKTSERIRLTRHKIAAYSEYLSTERERLERELTDAKRELLAKVEAISASKSDPVSVG